VINGKPVTQVPNSGREYSRTTTCLDTSTGKVLGSNMDYLDKSEVAGIPEDPAVAAIVAKYKALLGTRLDQQVAIVDGIFPRGGNPPVERSQETPMGDFLTDAMRSEFGTDFVLMNGGAIRDTLPANGYQPVNASLRRPGPGRAGPYDVTLGDLQAVLPFGNNAATTTITGSGLWSALEHGVAGWPTDGRFPQVSGLRYAFDPGRPVGSRVTSVTRADGTPIPRDAARYTITTVDYLVYGGDGYTTFSPTDSTIRRPIVDVLSDRLRADYAAGRVTLVPPPDGRITRVGG
jgi:5'-nucleotidase